MRITDITAIARPIDPAYPTNRAIAAFALAAVLGGTVFQLLAGSGWSQSALWGIGVGFAVFLAWALSREIDPDHDLSAFVGAGLAVVGTLFFDLPDMAVLFWMLVLLRVVNRTVGLPPRILDSLLLLGLGGWLTLQGNWVYGLMTALGFLLDGCLSPSHRRHLFFAALAFIITAILFIPGGRMAWEGMSFLPVVLAILGVSALFLPVVVVSRESRSVGDHSGELLNPRRIQAAQVLAVLTGLQVVLWNGSDGMVTVLSLWAALLGVSLYYLFGLARRMLSPWLSAR